MVHADHSSICESSKDSNAIFAGGEAAGWVVSFKNSNVVIYHAGDTALFSDMKLINDLYKPTHVILPIGGFYGMGPEDAAIAVNEFFTDA